MMRTIVLTWAILYSGLLTGQYSDSITVNLFMLDECKITQNMSGEINTLFEEFQSDSLQFLAFFPNFSSKKENIDSFMKKYRIEVPYKTDYFKTQAKRLGATVAPEVVVYDEKNQDVLYRGRINNSYAKIGSRRRVITQRDLYDVLMAVTKNQPISIKETKAIGCFINFSESL